jgi:agarase
MAFIDDCDLFLNVLAHRYFKVCHDAIKAADPNHLILGDKDQSPPPKSVIEAEQAHMDVLSVDLYNPDPRKLIERYTQFNKPVLISEFGFKAEDAGCRNTGAGQAVPTQQDRARVTRQFLEYALQEPCLVGYHWYELIDQHNVTTDANYGLVSKDNVPYELVINALSQINSEADRLRR